MNAKDEKLPLYTRNLFYKIRVNTGHDLRQHGVLRSMVLTLQALSWQTIYWSIDEVRRQTKKDVDDLEKKIDKTDVFALVKRFMPRLQIELMDGEARRGENFLLLPLFCLLLGVFSGFLGTMLYFVIGG